MIELEKKMQDLPKFPFAPIILVIILTTASLISLWAINSDNLNALNVLVNEDYKNLDLQQTILSVQKHVNKEIAETAYVKFLIFAIFLLWATVFTIAYKRVMHWKKALQTAFQQIAFSEARHRTLMNNASCCIFTGDSTGFILDVNRAGEILLGRSKEEIIGKNILAFIPDKDKDMIRKEFKALRDDTTVALNELSIVDAENKSHDVDFSMVMVNLGDEKLMLVIATETTERNRFRAQSILNDRLSSIGILAAGVAHELNNPMAWIKSNLQSIKTDLKRLKNEPNQPKLIESFEDSVGSMIEGSNRVADIIDNFRSFTRVDDTERTPFNVNEILESAINMVLPELKNHAKLKKALAIDLPMVEINKGRLHQVFINLLINAYQAMHHKDINQNKIYIKTYPVRDQVCISIQDTGEGIPDDILPHIFDLFFTTKPIGKGTGFGLFICHDIIQKFGGELKVETEIHKGTTFFVYLPITQKKINAEKQA